MIEIFKGEDGWYFRVKGMNGEKLAVSESYTRKTDAVRGARDLVAEVLGITADAASDGKKVV